MHVRRGARKTFAFHRYNSVARTNVAKLLQYNTGLYTHKCVCVLWDASFNWSNNKKKNKTKKETNTEWGLNMYPFDAFIFHSSSVYFLFLYKIHCATEKWPNRKCFSFVCVCWLVPFLFLLFGKHTELMMKCEMMVKKRGLLLLFFPFHCIVWQWDQQQWPTQTEYKCVYFCGDDNFARCHCYCIVHFTYA